MVREERGRNLAPCPMPVSGDGAERTEVQGAEGAILYATVGGGPLDLSGFNAVQLVGFSRLGKRAASRGFAGPLDEQNRHVIAAQVGFTLKTSVCQTARTRREAKLDFQGARGETNELAV